MKTTSDHALRQAAIPRRLVVVVAWNEDRKSFAFRSEDTRRVVIRIAHMHRQKPAAQEVPSLPLRCTLRSDQLWQHCRATPEALHVCFEACISLAWWKCCFGRRCFRYLTDIQARHMV